MVSAAEIRDRETFKLWLESLRRATEPQQVEAKRWSVILAHRAAMRVLPLFWNWSLSNSGPEIGVTTLVILRCAINAGVAGTHPTPAIATAAVATTNTAVTTRENHYNDDEGPHAGNLAAAESAEAAVATAATADSARAVEAAALCAFAVMVVAGDYAAAWQEVSADCVALTSGQPLDRQPLWSVRDNQFWSEDWNPFTTRWAETRERVLGQGSEWRFWADWYDKALTGAAQDWRGLLTEVALIPDEVWQRGPGAVAAEIARIEARAAQDVDGGSALTATQALDRNAKVVARQLGVLRAFVSEEIDRLRGRNSFYSTAEQEAHSERIAQLVKITEAVTVMQAALEAGAGGGSTALVVIDTQLPQVVDAAVAAEAAGGTPEVSAVIMSMAATIKHLTQAGAPGSLATAIAFAEMCLDRVKSWLPRKETTK